MDRFQPLPQIVEPVIIKLLLVESVGAGLICSTGMLEALYCRTIGGSMPGGNKARIALVAETIYAIADRD